MTYLEIVNEVLKRLRQPTVTSVAANEYSALVGIFVNEAKREVENSWDWSMLRASLQVPTVASTQTYALTGTNIRTRLLDAWNTTRRHELQHLKNNVYINYQDQVGTVASASPYYYDLQAPNSSGELVVRLYPTPTDVETLTFYLVIPQADLTSDATEVSVPSDPIIQSAYLRAINERGEDQGRLSELQAQIYQNTISAYISIDANKFSDEFTWQAI